MPTPEHGSMPFPEHGQLKESVRGLTTFVPSLTKDFGFEPKSVEAGKDERSSLVFTGGEDAAIARFEDYLHGSKAMRHYSETRNDLDGPDYSSKFSAWLANGCLSVRYVYHKTKQYEENVKEKHSTQKFVDELYWREWCHYLCLNQGDNVFHSYGVKGSSS